MNLECILKREGGTRAEIGGVEYHFEPLDDGAHVAAVERNDHIDRFLAIPEAYKLYHGDLSPKGAPLVVKATVVSDPTDLRLEQSQISASTVLYGSSVHEATYEIGDDLFQLGDIVQKAFEASGLSAEEWNGLDEDERNAKLDIVLDELAEAAEKAAAEKSAAGSAPDELAELVAQYVAKFGKKPHYKLSIENLKAALASE